MTKKSKKIWGIRGVKLLLLGFFLASLGCSKKLLVKSEPREAEVWINDVSFGKTPVEIPFDQLPAAQTLKIEIKKDAYGKIVSYMPSPSTGVLGTEVSIKLPKEEDEVEKYNKAMNMAFKAQQLAQARRPAQALKLAEEALKDHPQFAALHMVRASILFLSKNYDGASKAYQRVLELDATNPEATKMLSYLKTQGAQLGRSGRSTASSLGPDNAAEPSEPAASPVPDPSSSPVPDGATPVGAGVSNEDQNLNLNSPQNLPDSFGGDSGGGAGTGGGGE